MRPVPPEGDHPRRYPFTVFAVRADKLDVKANAAAPVVGFSLHSVHLRSRRSWGCSTAGRLPMGTMFISLHAAEISAPSCQAYNVSFLVLAFYASKNALLRAFAFAPRMAMTSALNVERRSGC
jgi:hypothetical protein